MFVKQTDGQTQFDHHVLILCRERGEMCDRATYVHRVAVVRHIPARTVSGFSWKAF
jgi:hypothetical protein